MDVDVALTIAEACELLEPAMTQRQLSGIIRHLRIRPAGNHRNGRPGHPANTYDWTELARLHAAITPWLATADAQVTNEVR